MGGRAQTHSNKSSRAGLGFSTGSRRSTPARAAAPRAPRPRPPPQRPSPSAPAAVAVALAAAVAAAALFLAAEPARACSVLVPVGVQITALARSADAVAAGPQWVRATLVDWGGDPDDPFNPETAYGGIDGPAPPRAALMDVETGELRPSSLDGGAEGGADPGPGPVWAASGVVSSSFDPSTGVATLSLDATAAKRAGLSERATFDLGRGMDPDAFSAARAWVGPAADGAWRVFFLLAPGPGAPGGGADGDGGDVVVLPLPLPVVEPPDRGDETLPPPTVEGSSEAGAVDASGFVEAGAAAGASSEGSAGLVYPEDPDGSPSGSSGSVASSPAWFGGAAAACGPDASSGGAATACVVAPLWPAPDGAVGFLDFYAPPPGAAELDSGSTGDDAGVERWLDLARYAVPCCLCRDHGYLRVVWRGDPAARTLVAPGPVAVAVAGGPGGLGASAFEASGGEPAGAVVWTASADSTGWGGSLWVARDGPWPAGRGGGDAGPAPVSTCVAADGSTTSVSSDGTVVVSDAAGETCAVDGGGGGAVACCEALTPSCLACAEGLPSGAAWCEAHGGEELADGLCGDLPSAGDGAVGALAESAAVPAAAEGDDDAGATRLDLSAERLAKAAAEGFAGLPGGTGMARLGSGFGLLLVAVAVAA